MELESVVKIIGCLVVALIIFAVPCLATLAFALNWEVFIKYLLTIFFISEVVTMAVCLYGSVD